MNKLLQFIEDNKGHVINDSFIRKSKEVAREYIFEERLKIECLTLKQKEIKTCVMINHGLTNKEIANYHNITTSAVEKRIYRIKQKFGVDKDTTIRDYLIKL